MSFTDQQKTDLAAPLSRANVSKRQGGGNRQLSYIESHHAIREANRIFGFDGWSSETVDIKLIVDRGGDYTIVAYMARVRITVYAGERTLIREGVGTGHGKDRDAGQAHEKAAKEAESDAQKRALRHFGDQFGLALYDKDQEHVTDALPANAPLVDKIEKVEPMPPKQEPKPTIDKRDAPPSHIIAPAADPKALALRKQEDDRKAKEAFIANSKAMADSFVATLKSRYEEAQSASNKQEINAVRSGHNAWIQTAQACWSKLVPADQSRVKRERLRLEDLLKNGVIDEIAEIAKEQAA